MTISPSCTSQFLLVVLGCLGFVCSPDPLFAQRGGGHGGGGGFHGGGGGGFRGGGWRIRGGGGFRRRQSEDSAAGHGSRFRRWRLSAAAIGGVRSFGRFGATAEAHTEVGYRGGRWRTDGGAADTGKPEARLLPVAVVLRVARCDPRDARSAIADGQWHSFGGARAGLRHSPALAEREMDGASSGIAQRFGGDGRWRLAFVWFRWRRTQR